MCANGCRGTIFTRLMDAHRFRLTVEENLGGRSPITVALAANLPREAIRSVLEGHQPSLERAANICEALGLEFYIGPPRPRLRASPSADDDLASCTPWPIQIGDPRDGCAPAGCMWFTKGFLQAWGLDPMRCDVHHVDYDAMAPVIESNSRILADLRRREKVPEGLYLVEADGERFVRRARQVAGDQWVMVCDNPALEDVPWPSDASILGRVVWTTKMLVPKFDLRVME